MKDILELIHNKKKEFSQLDLFKFFQDTSIPATDKTLWVPYMAPLVMDFAELNKSVFRKEPTDNKIQEIINKHTYEDESHWEWFLKDIETFGANTSLKFTDALRFIWSEKTKYTRKICRQIAMYTYNAEPVVVLIAIESVEAVFQIGLSAISLVIEELETINGKQYYYFGKTHLEIENSHSNHQIEAKLYIESIKLTLEQKFQCYKVVNLIFQLFTDSMNELMENTGKRLAEADELNFKDLTKNKHRQTLPKSTGIYSQL